MREFIYFSSKAVTSGGALSKNDLMQAGRMDIAIHSFIQGVFLSHNVRENVKFHFIFYGMPDPPKHIEITVKREEGLPEEEKEGRIDINKKNVADLIKRILYKYKEGEKREVMPGCWVEKRSFLEVVEKLKEEGKTIFVLDKKGEDIRKIKNFSFENPVFILGDHEGLPKKEFKRLKNQEGIRLISVGPKMYFASQTVAVVNNELDYRGL
jgi:tRNA (pseudouridine54-N1)-methyltransferase